MLVFMSRCVFVVMLWNSCTKYGLSFTRLWSKLDHFHRWVWKCSAWQQSSNENLLNMKEIPNNKAESSSGQSFQWAQVWCWIVLWFESILLRQISCSFFHVQRHDHRLFSCFPLLVWWFKKKMRPLVESCTALSVVKFYSIWISTETNKIWCWSQFDCFDRLGLIRVGTFCVRPLLRTKISWIWNKFKNRNGKRDLFISGFILKVILAEQLWCWIKLGLKCISLLCYFFPCAQKHSSPLLNVWWFPVQHWVFSWKGNKWQT